MRGKLLQKLPPHSFQKSLKVFDIYDRRKIVQSKAHRNRCPKAMLVIVKG